MSTYKMDMSGEKEPARRVLLPEGWRKFEVLEVEDTTSKAGNKMFVFKVVDSKTGAQDKLYCVAEKGKRWFLKALLYAVGIEPDGDGNYNWDVSGVLTKAFMGEVVHEDNEWVNREGETVKTKRHKVAQVKRVEKVEEVAWDDDK